PAAARLGAAGAQVIRTATEKQVGLDLAAVLRALAERGITRLMVEGGSRGASAFVARGLLDEGGLLRGENAICPGGGAGLGGLPCASITQSRVFRSTAGEALDKDTLTIYERA